MYGSAEGSAQVQFLCDGDVVHEEAGFRAPAYSPDRKFIMMHEVAADDDLQLYLFPTDDSGLPDHNRSFGAFGGRFSGLIA
jgi:Tol biopolymer transport system component